MNPEMKIKPKLSEYNINRIMPKVNEEYEYLNGDNGNYSSKPDDEVATISKVDDKLSKTKSPTTDEFQNQQTINNYWWSRSMNGKRLTCWKTTKKHIVEDITGGSIVKGLFHGAADAMTKDMSSLTKWGHYYNQAKMDMRNRDRNNSGNDDDYQVYDQRAVGGVRRIQFQNGSWNAMTSAGNYLLSPPNRYNVTQMDPPQDMGNGQFQMTYTTGNRRYAVVFDNGGNIISNNPV